MNLAVCYHLERKDGKAYLTSFKSCRPQEVPLSYVEETWGKTEEGKSYYIDKDRGVKEVKNELDLYWESPESLVLSLDDSIYFGVWEIDYSLGIHTFDSLSKYGVHLLENAGVPVINISYTDKPQFVIDPAWVRERMK